MQDNESLTTDALAIWQSGVAAVDAQKLTFQTVEWTGGHFKIGHTRVDLDSIDRIAVVGGGKASGWMACGLVEALGPDLVSRKVSGWINVPDDQVIECGPVNIFGARPPAENLATANVLYGTDKILELAGGLTERDLCVCLISGGGSALLEKPVPPVSLGDIRELTQACSANKSIDIKQLNTIRKKLSHIKGGGLAVAAHPAKVVSLILSDIIGDPIELIASGPTVKDEQTVTEALEIMSRLNLDRNRFAAIWNVMEQMKTGSPKRPWPNSFHVDQQIIGNNRLAVEAAAKKSAELGYETQVTFADPSDSRTAAETAQDLVGEIRALAGTRSPVCLISGGEPTVQLCDSPGRGGRNQQLVLAALDELVSGQPVDSEMELCILSLGTDGEDGNVPVAGAAIDQATVARVIELDLIDSVKAALNNNDAFSFLDVLGGTIKMGTTRTNVCDLRIAIVS